MWLRLRVGHVLIFFVVLTGITSGTHSASAQRSEYEETDRKIMSLMRPEWLACKVPADCSYLPYSCGGKFAFNKRFQREAEKAIYSVGSSSWLACNADPSAGIVACNGGQCTVR